ncbi:ABC transporter substrate-binding protein [Halobacterium yunchengense]|uniref:ABC transporter substrate-binding protein n=1 Tax=Halobacterium yunchengense TaxID=3108497 RepID=UPI00300810A3
MTGTIRSRRAFLASAASVAVAGCSGFRYRDRYQPGERVSLAVSAPPADDDRAATTIGRRLADRLSALGVDASFQPKAQSQLYLDALINHDFDVFVARHPGLARPDALYPLLHSKFAPEPGWQNPFGSTSVAIDDSLEALRSSSDTAAALAEFLAAYVERVPFAVVAAPEFLTARRRSLSVPAEAVTERPLDVLGQLAAVDLDRPLRCGIFSGELTENRNPIAGEFRWTNQLLGLVYDSLARRPRDADGFVPWAAGDWRFDGDTLVADLRPGQTFHDGTPVTADDVVFTLEFLSDTSMGEASSPLPATRFRGRTTLVSSAHAVDDTTVRFRVASDVDPNTAERVLTLPILPEAEWSERTDLVDDRVTKALVWENRKPVGSGPLAFASATVDESVRLEPFADHFLADVADEPAARYAAALDGEGVYARYAPSGEDALAALADGRLDTSIHEFPLAAFVDADDADDVGTATAPSRGLYVVGYNVRRGPLSDFHFRQILARLHDREAVARETFAGYATPTDVPVVPAWDTDDVATDEYTVGSFPGRDGELDADAGRRLFEDAGYTYDDDGNLFR